MNKKKFRITKEKYTELKERFKYLDNTERDRINNLMLDNKATESSRKFAAAIQEKNVFEREIFEVKNVLENSEIVDLSEDRLCSGKIEFGNEIVLKSEDGKSQLVVRIVDPVEADPTKGKISTESPIGKLLIDKRIGDYIKLPDETVLEIVKIS